MSGQNRLSTGFAQQGVVLLEALIAILLFSVGVLALVGLQATMVKNTAGAKSRIDASYIAQQRIGQMWADPANLGTYVEVNTPVPELPNGARTTAVSGIQATVTINWQAPGESPHNFTTTASISGG